MWLSYPFCVQGAGGVELDSEEMSPDEIAFQTSLTEPVGAGIGMSKLTHSHSAKMALPASRARRKSGGAEIRGRILPWERIMLDQKYPLHVSAAAACPKTTDLPHDHSHERKRSRSPRRRTVRDRMFDLEVPSFASARSGDPLFSPVKGRDAYGSMMRSHAHG